MKNFIKYILQKILGFENYLFLFSVFKINTLRFDKKERDFFFFLETIPENSTVLDIGANIGIMTAHLSRKAKTVYAVEPVPENFRVLKKIIFHHKLNNVIAHNFALGDKQGKTLMVLPVIHSVKMQGLSHVVHSSINEFNEGKKFTVEMEMADTFFANTKITAIKIDVENFEYFVLRGAENILKKYKPVIYIELWENENRQKCFEFLKHLGYSINVVENGRLKNFKKQQKQNFICN